MCERTWGHKEGKEEEWRDQLSTAHAGEWKHKFYQVIEGLCSLQSVLFCSVWKELAGRAWLGSLTVPSGLERWLWRTGSVISMLDVFAEGIYRCSSEVMAAYDSNDGFITQMASLCVQWFSWHVKLSRYMAINLKFRCEMFSQIFLVLYGNFCCSYKWTFFCLGTFKRRETCTVIK